MATGHSAHITSDQRSLKFLGLVVSVAPSIVGATDGARTAIISQNLITPNQSRTGIVGNGTVFAPATSTAVMVHPATQDHACGLVSATFHYPSLSQLRHRTDCGLTRSRYQAVNRCASRFDHPLRGAVDYTELRSAHLREMVSLSTQNSSQSSWSGARHTQ